MYVSPEVLWDKQTERERFIERERWIDTSLLSSCHPTIHQVHWGSSLSRLHGLTGLWKAACKLLYQLLHLRNGSSVASALHPLNRSIRWYADTPLCSSISGAVQDGDRGKLTANRCQETVVQNSSCNIQSTFFLLWFIAWWCLMDPHAETLSSYIRSAPRDLRENQVSQSL